MASQGPILNYTTKIEAAQTATEILGILAKIRARSSTITYDERQEPSELTFTLRLGEGQEVAYRLPVRVDGVHTVLQGAWNRGKLNAGQATRVQARKVAWRILKVWVEAQVAAIQAGLVEPSEVMLPYALTNGRTTFYEAFLESTLALGPGGKR